MRIQINLAEGEDWLGRKQGWMRLQERIELGIARLGVRSEIVGNEFEFLAKPAANNGVVAIKPHAQSLAVRSFFADVVADQTLQFFLCRRTLPSASEACGNIFESALRDHNFARFIGFVTRHEAEDRENDSPQQEKVKQRFAKNLHKDLQNYLAGVYQMGEV